jgi:DNA-directed RNA polymerase subunit M/transcription elongation factor TFIIS
MDFCQLCGTRTFHHEPKNVLICRRCGHEAFYDVIKSVDAQSVQSLPQVEVIDEHAANLRTLPTVNVFCDNCDQNQRAETWTISGQSDGISTITVFRCLNCGRTWREIDRG